MVYSALPKWFIFITRGKIFGVHIYLFIAFLCLLIITFIFKYTYLGKHIIAVGENESAAAKSGINISIIKILYYMIGSVFFVIASIIMTSRSGTATSSNGVGLEITGVASVFLSEVYFIPSSYTPKRINAIKLVISTMLIGIIENGMYLIGWNRYIRYIVLGTILVFAIYQYNRLPMKNKKGFFINHS
jgi:ribose transport system permease protein